MANPNAIVSKVVRIEPALDRPAQELVRREGGVEVELEGGRKVRLDPDNPRSAGFAQVLDGLRRLGAPAYLELDPASAAVTRLLLPHVSRVVSVRNVGGALEVELEESHARHTLPPAAEDFAAYQTLLREAAKSGAVVVLTVDDAQRIIDLRPGPALEGPSRPFPVRGVPEARLRPPSWPLRLLRWIWFWCFWPWRWWGCLSKVKAQQVFDAMNATSCDPLTVPVPCIPFLYPDDGCWGRAHEMCRLMIAMGLSPRKVWISGNLNVPTKNNPNCTVGWGWHVAPTLCVRTRWFCHQRMVIDPSLFTTPVSRTTWKSVQGDPNATLTNSDATLFIGSTSDPTFTSQNSVLANYRLALQNRANLVGPPPYANCP